MNVIRRFTLQSLKRNKKWTIVTAVGVIISAGMIAAVSAFAVSLTDWMQGVTIAETGNWHAEFDQVPADKVHIITEDKLTKEAMLSRDVGYARLAGAQNPNKPYLFIEQYDDRSMKNFSIKLLSGRLPQNDREIVLSEQVAANGKVGYKAGDRITLAVGERRLDGKALGQNDSLKDGAGVKEVLTPEFTEIYTVVGIMAKPGLEPFQAPGYTALTYLDDSKLASGGTVNVSITGRNLDRDFYSQVDTLAQKAGIAKDKVVYNDALLRDYGVMGDNNISQSLRQITYIVIAIIMVASIVLIYNAFAISVAGRTRQLGMLASVGATKRQKRQNVYFEGFLIGLTGIPLGIFAGIGGTGIILAALNPFLRGLLNSGTIGPRLVVSWQAILTAILFSALAILVSAYIPARRASRITPIDAIRQSREIKLTAKAIRAAGLTRRLFGFEGELALKNLKRNKKKYRATILSLIISIVLFLTVSVYGDLLGLTTEAAIGKVNYDLSLHINQYSPAEETAVFQYSPDREKAIYRQVAGLDAVKDYAVLHSVYGSVGASAPRFPDGTDQVALVSLNEEAFARYAASIGADAGDFNDVTKPQAILADRDLTQENGRYVESETVKASIGDALSLVTKLPGEDGGAKEVSYDMQIGAKTGRRPLGIPTVHSPIGWGQPVLVTSEKILDSLIGKDKVPAQLFMTTDDSDKLATEIQSVLRANSVEYGDGMIFDNADTLRQQKEFILFSKVFAYGFIILISLICIANIFNIISTNVALRRKEFAMLRSVGMTPPSFNKMIRFESVFYGLKALFYGLPLSAAIAWFLNRGMGMGISSKPFTLPWGSYGAVILLVFVIVGATMLYSSSKIKRENIIDALKDESN